MRFALASVFCAVLLTYAWLKDGRPITIYAFGAVAEFHRSGDGIALIYQSPEVKRAYDRYGKGDYNPNGDVIYLPPVTFYRWWKV
jgi:hypothetical protein